MAGFAARLQSEFGKLDVVFANAGTAQPMPFSDVNDSNIDSQIDVNFKGVIYTIQSMLPLLNKPSSVVLTSTTMIEKGVAGMSVYAATKRRRQGSAPRLFAAVRADCFFGRMSRCGPLAQPLRHGLWAATNLAPASRLRAREQQAMNCIFFAFSSSQKQQSR